MAGLPAPLFCDDAVLLMKCTGFILFFFFFFFFQKAFDLKVRRGYGSPAGRGVSTDPIVYIA